MKAQRFTAARSSRDKLERRYNIPVIGEEACRYIVALGFRFVCRPKRKSLSATASL
jgi:hypothetical protein